MPIFRSRRPPGKKRPMGGGKKRPSGGKSFGGKSFGGKKRRPAKRKKKPVKKPPPPNLEITGMEGYYLKQLIEDEKIVSVVLNGGGQIRGYVRYYDLDTFSIGPADGGPKVFLRKESIRYLVEEE